MRRRNALVVISEILNAVEGIERAALGKAVEDLSGDWLLKHGIERGLEIVSEACRHLPDDMLEMEPEIPWKKVRGLGNVLRHDYHNVAERIIWAVVVNDLPPLKQAVERLRDKVMRQS